MRSRFLVCYDIANPKRLRAVFRKMLGFGDPIQYSVFKCDLSPAEKVLLVEALHEIVNLREDRVMIVRLGLVDDDNREQVEFLGTPLTTWQTHRTVII